MRDRALSPLRVAAVSALLLIPVVIASCGGDSTAPPKATTLAFITPPPALAETMVPLTIQPVLQTVDANGQPVGSSAVVTATVIGTTGVVAASGTATTTSTGRASFSGLTLGAINGAVGQVTLQFAAPGLTPITATVELRCAVLPLSIGQTVNGSLTNGDCTFGGERHLNKFALTTSQPVTAIRLTAGGSFPPMVSVNDPNVPGAFWGYGPPPTQPGNNFSYKVLLPAGRNLIAVSAQDQSLGTYTLTTSAAPEELSCDSTTPAAVSPLTSAQTLATGDCVENSFLEDALNVGLVANATITASMRSSAFEPQIKLIDQRTNVLATSSTAPGSTSITFTAQTSAAFYLVFTSSVAGASGPYTFSMNVTYPAASAVSRELRLPLGGQAMMLRKGQPTTASHWPGRRVRSLTIRSK